MDLGSGARTIALSHDGKYLFAAMNGNQEIIQMDYEKWEVVDSVDVLPYPVGLATSPVSSHVIVTSQGKKGRGGNFVGIYKY